MSEDIDEYKKRLKRLAEKGSDEFIDNSSTEHAVAMIEALFHEAKGRVCIFSDHLNPIVYGKTEVKEAATEFMQRDKSQLVVILQFKQSGKDKLLQNTFLSDLAKYKEKISIYEAVNELKDFSYHFMVTKTDKVTKDGKENNAMRYELDIKEHKATGSFNAGDFGDKLFEFFDKIQEVQDKLPEEDWLN